MILISRTSPNIDRPSPSPLTASFPCLDLVRPPSAYESQDPLSIHEWFSFSTWFAYVPSWAGGPVRQRVGRLDRRRWTQGSLHRWRHVRIDFRHVASLSISDRTHPTPCRSNVFLSRPTRLGPSDSGSSSSSSHSRPSAGTSDSTLAISQAMGGMNVADRDWIGDLDPRKSAKATTSSVSRTRRSAQPASPT